MPTLHLRSWLLDLDNWSAVRAWAVDTWPEGSLVLSEASTETRLGRPTVWPEEATRGHLFDERAHLAWRRLGSRIRVVLAGAPPRPPDWGPPDAEEQQDTEVQDRHLQLWGLRRPDEDFWLESQIPRVMAPPSGHPSDHAPPADGLQRRRLAVRAHSDPATGALIWAQFVGLTYESDDDS